jgi:hypothetical protein
MSECNFYCDYKIIIYPICSYLFYKFCKKYYKYILLVLDNFEQYDRCYDNTDYCEKIENKMIDTSTTTNDNILFAFSQIPT